MTDVVVFHHAQGLTPGIRALAERLEAAGHTTHTPDLYDGRVFDSLDDGVAHAEEVGFGTLIERGRVAAEQLTQPDTVYVGFSLGVLPAQMLAQTRPGARGAVLCHSCLPTGEFGEGWPPDVPVQIHGMGSDPFFAEEGDIDAARSIVATAPDAELFVYEGNSHLFADASLPSYEPGAAALLTDRLLEFLARIA